MFLWNRVRDILFEGDEMTTPVSILFSFLSKIINLNKFGRCSNCGEKLPVPTTSIKLAVGKGILLLQECSICIGKWGKTENEEMK